MNQGAKYYHLVGLNQFGQYQIIPQPTAQDFFFHHCSDLMEKEIQTQLIYWYRDGKDNKETVGLCLRCYISQQMLQICRDKARRYGDTHDFTEGDLLVLILDPLKRNKIEHASLTSQIIETFDPEKSSLSTWTNTIVRGNKEVKRFLLEHGIEEVSNWAILNERTIGGLRRILSQFYCRSPAEIDRHVQLLTIYHQVYRDRLCCDPGRKRWRTPNEKQLEEIAALLLPGWQLTPEEVLAELQELSQLIRDYRIYSKTGNVSGASFQQLPESKMEAEEQDSNLDQLLAGVISPCLAKAVEEAIASRFDYLRRKKLQTAKAYIQGLELFHCQGLTQGEIAAIFRWPNQSKISRLLALKSLRTDVGQKVLLCLSKGILKLAAASGDRGSLESLEQQVMEVIDPKVKQRIEEAEKEAVNSKNRVIKSEFALAVCSYCQNLNNEQ